MVTVKGEWVEFRFFRPGARRVTLAGDFNNWRDDEVAMRDEGNGYWSARLRLPVGEFRFRYVADGAWYADYAAFGVEPGQFGLDSVVRVSPTPIALASPSHAAERTAEEIAAA